MVSQVPATARCDREPAKASPGIATTSTLRVCEPWLFLTVNLARPEMLFGSTASSWFEPEPFNARICPLTVTVDASKLDPWIEMRIPAVKLNSGVVDCDGVMLAIRGPDLSITTLYPPIRGAFVTKAWSWIGPVGWSKLLRGCLKTPP